MKKSVFLLAAVVAALFSCGQKPAGPVPVLDVSQRSHPEKELILQEIATVEYLPLEAGEGFMLGEYPKIHYLDDDVIVTNEGPTIMFFDRKTGRAINSFSREGRGPGEYLGVGSVAVDMKAGELFVLENVIHSDRKSPMYVYDLQGRHLRTLEMPIMGFQNYFHVYDDRYLFFYNAPDANEPTQDPAPYKLISRTDTTHTVLPVEFPGRDHMDVIKKQGDAIVTHHNGGTVVLKTVDGYIFSEPGVDTVYGWNRRDGRLTPLVARTPAFGSMEVPVAISVTGQSDDYLFLEFGERRDYERGQARRYDFAELVYDKTDGRFYMLEVRNGDYVERGYVGINNISSNSVAYPPGVFVKVIQAVRLVDLCERGKLQGPLAEVASKLKEDDNPVLMIATFK